MNLDANTQKSTKRTNRAVSRIWIQLLFFFCMPYSGHQGQSNEVTRQLSKLPLHLGCGGCCEPLVESKLNLVKYLTMQHLDFFLEYHFLKLVNWCFNDTKICNVIWRLRVQNIKYLMHLEKNICLIEIWFIKFCHKIYIEKMLFFWLSLLFKQ